MSNSPYNPGHLRYRYNASIPADRRALRPVIDDGLFHHGELEATLSVVNEVANQLDMDSLPWCHFMEEVLRNELRDYQNREDILCGLHERIAAQLFQQNAGPKLHR